MNLVLMLLALAGGVVLPFQAAMNARLGRDLGSSAGGALASFVIGGVALLLYMLATREHLPATTAYLRVPVWAWVGGILGAFFVGVVIFVTPRIGVATLMGLVVAGQIGASVVLDHYGMLGLPRHPFSAWRLLGVCLLVAGVVVVKRF
jgi:transporter family-2 protein